jgi:drug/metabolite transporter (DMT)-like permease
MMTAVCLQIVGAVLLKTIADHRVDWSILVLAGGVGMVICLNLIRLGVWGFAHKHFPLSTTFPLSSLFYPAMLIVAAGFGDEIGVRQVVGALLIASGTMWLSTRVPT